MSARVGHFAACAGLALCGLMAGCAQVPPPGARSGPGAPARPHPLSYPPDGLESRVPLTRAERTDFMETSTYADVVAFVDSLRQRSRDIHVTSFGRTTQGKDLPLVVMSRPIVRTPAEARRLNRPVVYIQANIHGGEVEGKEALLALLRELDRDTYRNVLDSVVILAVPIYNADGNDAFGPQERNRYEQNGPQIIGQRPNAQGLDLNRDYVKAEAPETQASLAFFRAWDPDVFIDLHTTDGSFHGYNLTWSPPLNPAALFSGPYTRDTVLPALQDVLNRRDQVRTFPYGNFVSQDSVEQGWYTYDARPRFGTNYYGLRGRVAILSEAYSHDPLKQRIASTYAFLVELLSTIGDNAVDFLDVGRDADRRTTSFATDSGRSPAIPLRSRFTTHPRTMDVLVEDLVATGDSSRSEPGVPPGIRRTGRVHTSRIPVYDRFEPTLERALPYAWIIPPAQAALLEPLRRHGVFIETIPEGGTAMGRVFVVDSVLHAERPFQGHRETRLAGRWQGVDSLVIAPASYVVRAGQPLGILALYLLDPESDDGLTTWNMLDAWLAPGSPFPIARVEGVIAGVLRAVP